MTATSHNQSSNNIVSREIDLSPDGILRALLSLDPRRRLSLLDSSAANTNSASARYLIAAFDPFEIIEASGDSGRIENPRAGKVTFVDGLDPLALLAERLSLYRVSSDASAAHKIFGGCVATFSYELVHRLERLQGRRKLSIEPDAVFAFYDTFIVHDYATGRTECTSIAGSTRLNEVCEILQHAARQTQSAPEIDSSPSATYSSNFSREQYCAAVERIKEHIFAGDIYQANLTQQFSCVLNGLSPEEVFWRLRRDHPAPFAALLRRREDTVISASPERFLRVTKTDGERLIEAWPIKGTRRRGRDAAEDARLRAELLASEKDRAENVMIVDLLRNDLGRVCRFGSVEVAELCALVEHPTLFHLVSRVRGTLRENVSVNEILRAAFPCGSITGAPKIRAMEIIEEYETRARGLSMGTIGYFAFNGPIDLNVAIRTMVVRDNIARFNAGGGITAESDAESEYAESLLKARALLRALGCQT